MQNKGLIFDIQHFAVHDGPGIRTLVFLKGCNFRCPWCENPEGISPKQEIMYFPKRCIGDFECIERCPENAIRRNTELNRVEVLWERCNNCLKCVPFCYPEAIKIAGRWMTVEEVLNEVKDDKIFYGNTGGITLSGGEPTLQKDFVVELLKACHDLGINTAVETNGSLDKERDFYEIIKYVDHMLIDIKHIDSKTHIRFTGADNKNTLNNFRLAIENCPHVIARVPIIPNFNMNEKDILDIANFVKASGGKEIHLLPYHSLGSSKSENLGRAYKYPEKKSLRYDDVLPFKELIKKNYNLIVSIGG